LLKEKADQRLLESQNYFKDVRAESIVETKELPKEYPKEVPENRPDVRIPIPINDRTDELIKMFKQQHKILSGILESQIKIIELLQKK